MEERGCNMLSFSVPPLVFSTYTVSTSKATGAGSTKSSIYKFEFQRGETSVIEVGEGNLKLDISAPEGKIINYVNIRNLVEESVEQSFSFYTGYYGTNDKMPQKR